MRTSTNENVGHVVLEIENDCLFIIGKPSKGYDELRNVHIYLAKKELEIQHSISKLRSRGEIGTVVLMMPRHPEVAWCLMI